jgi:hypothetical protein
MFYLYVCPILILIILYISHRSWQYNPLQDLHVNKFSSGGGGVDSVLTEEELGGPLSLRELG